MPTQRSSEIINECDVQSATQSGGLAHSRHFWLTVSTLHHLKKVNFEGIIYERLEAICLLSELTENSGLVIKINNGIQSNFPSQRSGRLNCNQSLQVNSQGIYQVKGLAPPCAKKCQTLIGPMFTQVLSARGPVAFLDN